MSSEWEGDWTKLPGRLIVISGASGSGKSTVVQRLLARPDLRLQVSVSATTRVPGPTNSPTAIITFSGRAVSEDSE